VGFSRFHEIEYRDALNKESAMDLPNSPLSILNNSVSPQLIKELGIDEAVKIRCKLIKRLIEANQNTLNSSRLTFAKATFRWEVLIFQKVKFKHGLMSLTQYKELVKNYPRTR
jgi:hypothetical protein